MGRITPDILQQLLDRHTPALELYARQWTRAADDCVQEAFIRLARQSPAPSEPAPWLFRVVRNRAISMARSEQRRRRREERAARREADFSHSPSTTVDPDALQRALEKLELADREIVVARVWGELTFAQIAELTRTSTSSAHRRYEAALRQLRNQLEPSCLPHNTIN